MFIKVRNKNGASGLSTPVECSSIRLRDQLKAYYMNKKKELTPIVRAKNISLQQTTSPTRVKNQPEDQLRQPFGFDKHRLEGLIKEEISILKKNAQCIKKSISKFSLNKDSSNRAIKECLNSYAFVQKSRRTTECNQESLIPNFQHLDISQHKLRMGLPNESSVTKILKRISTRKNNNRMKVFSRIDTHNVYKNASKSQKVEAIKSLQRNKSGKKLKKSTSQIKTKVINNKSNISVQRLHLDRLNMKLLSSINQLSPWKQETSDQCLVLPPMREWNS